MKQTSARRQFVICVDNEGYPASLERWKVYRALPDREADAHGLVRVIDESGEDYLYPSVLFRPIVLPSNIRRLWARRAATLVPRGRGGCD